LNPRFLHLRSTPKSGHQTGPRYVQRSVAMFAAMYRHAAASIKIVVWMANTALSYSALAVKAPASKRY
jgi:hypothetical protein